MLWKTFILSCLLALVCAPQTGLAIIIDTATGTENTTAPDTFPYWEGVGKIGGGSCVYLGDGYFLTAYHVKVLDIDSGHYANVVNINGQNYNILSSSWYRPTYSGSSADLALFRVDQEVPVPASDTMIAAGASLELDTPIWTMGYGYNRAANKTYWNSTWKEVSSTSLYIYSGYKWSTSARTKRWGTNNVEGNNMWLNDGYGNSRVYKSIFDEFGDTEGALAIGDSGGPMYSKVGDVWQLSGINIARDAYSGQPGPSSVYGNSLYTVDLSYYRNQIIAGPGDATRNGIVDFSDYLAMSAKFGQTMTSWSDGDFNGDYTVNFSDYLILSSNFGAGAVGASAGQVVPEPVGCLLLLGGAVGLLSRRGRRG